MMKHTPRHTPGPWKVDVRVGCVAVYPANTPDEQSYCLDGANLWAIHYKCGVRTNGGWKLEPEVEANARLIAASPKMASLLQKLVADGWSASISEEAKEILQEIERVE